MAAPSVVMNTADGILFENFYPTLEFTGSEASSNGIEYQIRVSSPLTLTPTATAPGAQSAVIDGKFVAALDMGSGNTMGYSSNGFSWKESNDGPFSFNPSARFRHLNGEVGYAPNGTGVNLRISQDGIDWDSISLNSNDIAYGAGMYVAISRAVAGQVLTSTDKVTWTARPTGIAAYLGPIVFNGNVFYASTLSSPHLAVRSHDGITWEPAGLGAGIFATSIVNIGTEIYSTQGLSDPGVYKSSDDGETFSSIAAAHTIPLLATDGRTLYSISRHSGTGNHRPVVRVYDPEDGSWEIIYNEGTSSSFSTGGSVATLGAVSILSLRKGAGDSHGFIRVFTDVKRVSRVDEGFENTLTPLDVSPFISGEKVSYTMQDPLPSGEYTWSVRAKSPDGDNTWSSWSTPRAFSVRRAPNPGIFMQFLT